MLFARLSVELSTPMTSVDDPQEQSFPATVTLKRCAKVLVREIAAASVPAWFALKMLFVASSVPPTCFHPAPEDAVFPRIAERSTVVLAAEETPPPLEAWLNATSVSVRWRYVPPAAMPPPWPSGAPLARITQ